MDLSLRKNYRILALKYDFRGENLRLSMQSI